MRRILSILALLGAMALLVGCVPGQSPTEAPSHQITDQESTDPPASQEEVKQDQLFSDRDFDTEFKDTPVYITLSGTCAQWQGSGVACEDGRLTISREGTYCLSGSFTGSVVIECGKEEKVQLVLDNAHITAEDTAALYILQADKVFLTLAQGSENTLANTHGFPRSDENTVDAALFSKEDLTCNGSGSLTVESPAGHGIVCKDSLRITGGSFCINAAAHGIAGKDEVAIADGSFTVTSGKDAIHAENDEDAEKGYLWIREGSYTLCSDGDGLSASAWLQISGGSFAVTCGGGSENGRSHTSQMGGFGGGGHRPGGFGGAGYTGQTQSTDTVSAKGIKASGELRISGGLFQLNCADDAVHSNNSITVSGGDFTVATGDDGIHAEETLTVLGGSVKVTESYEGLEALHIRIEDGTVQIVSTDDGLNAAGGADESGFGGDDRFGGHGGFGGMSAGNGSIVISGGQINIRASGDGIDANGSLSITGGYTVVEGPTQGDTATLDYDTTATIDGGVFIGTGASGMAQTFSGGSQGVIAVQVGLAQAGTEILFTNSQGENLLSYFPSLSYSVVIFSSPDLEKGQSYRITVGDASAEFTAQ